MRREKNECEFLTTQTPSLGLKQDTDFPYTKWIRMPKIAWQISMSTSIVNEDCDATAEYDWIQWNNVTVIRYQHMSSRYSKPTEERPKKFGKTNNWIANNSLHSRHHFGKVFHILRCDEWFCYELISARSEHCKRINGIYSMYWSNRKKNFQKLQIIISSSFRFMLWIRINMECSVQKKIVELKKLESVTNNY